MTLRHLKVFVELCEHRGNVTQTADALGVSQSNVSRTLTELEDYYKVELFVRLAKRLYLTQAGREFYKEAKSIIDKFNLAELEAHRSNDENRLRVGCANLTVGRFLPQAISRFKAKYPQYTVYVCNRAESKIREQLRQNEIDIAIIQGMESDLGMTCTQFLDTRFSIVASPSLGFVSGQTVSAKELVKYPLLLKEPDSAVRVAFDAALYERGLVAEPVWESCYTALLLDAAARGLGVAVVTRELATDAISRGLVLSLHVPDIRLRLSTGIAYSKDRKLSQPEEDFIAECRHAYDE